MNDQRPRRTPRALLVAGVLAVVAVHGSLVRIVASRVSSRAASTVAIVSGVLLAVVVTHRVLLGARRPWSRGRPRDRSEP